MTPEAPRILLGLLVWTVLLWAQAFYSLRRRK